MNMDPVGATVFFGGVAYLVVIFGLLYRLAAHLIRLALAPVASISDLAPESEQ